jgi:transposase
LILLWDGASYHKGLEMQEYLEAANWKHSRDEWPVTCLLFAPYAPEQNPIEDVWLKAKNYLRKNWHRCRNFDDIRAIFEEALNTLSFQFEKLSLYLPFLQMI